MKLSDIPRQARSDDLPIWRRLLQRTPDLNHVLPLLPAFVVVLDANRIWGQLTFLAARRVKAKARTELMEAIDAGVLIAFAPQRLDAEVRRLFPLIQKKTGLTLERLATAWAELSRRIHVVEAGLVAHIQVKNEHVDADDADYVRVLIAVGAIGVCSDDGHFRSMDQKRIGVGAIRDLRDYGRAASSDAQTKFAAILIGQVTVLVPSSIFKAAWRVVKCLPRLVKVGLALGGVAALLHDGARAMIIRGLSRLRDLAGRVFRALAPALHEFAKAIMLTERAAAAKRRAVLSGLPKSSPQPLRVHVFAGCAASTAPASATQIETYARSVGYTSRSRSTRGYIARLARADRRLVEDSPGRWRVRTA